MNEKIREELIGWSNRYIDERLAEIDTKHDEYLANVGRDEEEDGEE